MKLRTWLQGAGVAALILFPFYRSLLDMQGETRMHTPVSVTTLALSFIANLILASLMFLLVGMGLRRLSRWEWLRLFVPAFVLACLFEMIYIARAGWVSTSLWSGTLVLVLVFGFVLHWRWRRGEKLLWRLSGALLVGLGFFCIFVALKLLRSAMWHQLPNSSANTIAETVDHSNRPRVIWILFDELSYLQTFGERYQNLQLPNFDEFRKSSTLFTDTQPIINFTEDAIPSIFLGQRISRVDYPTNNRLEVGHATGLLFPFDAAETPFALARHYGLTAGVVGWTNPYCGMLAPYLNRCYWTNEFEDPTLSAQENFWLDFLYPWKFYGEIVGRPKDLFSRRSRTRIIGHLMWPSPGQYILRREYIYRDLMQHADRMLQPSGPDFVFLHLPLPHPPGFYNRKTQQFDTSGDRSYVDNLALVDKTLGQLLTTLKQSPRWKKTSVIVCGDHSWRVYAWADSPDWTAEDEAASHGRVFDPRPVLMVHLAGQTTPGTMTAPFPLLRVHNILDDLVQGKQPSFSSDTH